MSSHACPGHFESRAFLDIQGALTRLGGRKSLYLKMLKRFESEFGNVSAALDRSLTEKDFAAASRLAHNLKAVAGSIGAMALYEIAAKLEKAVLEEYPQLVALVEEFRVALKAACGCISDFLAKEAESARPPC